MKLRHSSCRKRHIREEVHYARADKTEVRIEKEDEASERQKLGLFFQDHTSKPLGERELFFIHSPDVWNYRTINAVNHTDTG